MRSHTNHFLDLVDLMETPGAGEINHRLAFLKTLQVVTNKIHATSNADEIMLEMSQDICNLFNCDRLTIYVLSEDKQSIVSKVKTGLNSFKDIRLPISEQSVAGYVAATRKAANIRDVYDEVELKSYSPSMQFLKEVDRRTGYRSKQMLVAPILDMPGNELLGVIQLINNRSDAPFPALAEEGILSLAQTLAVALTQRLKPRPFAQSKYDALVTDGVISAAELDLAQRSARRKGLGLEEALINEFQVKPSAIGTALSRFFGVPYEPFKRPHQADGLVAESQARICRSQRVVADRRGRRRGGGAGDGPRAHQECADRQQHLSEGQDRLSGDDQRRIHQDDRTVLWRAL